MNDWWIPVLLIALLLWFTRHKWKGWFTDVNFGEPPHQAGERFRDYEENRQRALERKEIDRILEKISGQGMDSLTTKEKDLLEKASQREKRHSP
jgi:hypothetical protein